MPRPSPRFPKPAAGRRCLALAVGAVCIFFCASLFATARQAPPVAGPETPPAPSPEDPQTPDEAHQKPAEASDSEGPEKPETDEPDTPPEKPADDEDDPEPSAEGPTKESAEEPVDDQTTEKPPGEDQLPEQRQGPTDPVELEAFIDGIMAVHTESKHIAGATIGVVADNRPVLVKGYGYADVEAKEPVDPAKTMFRIGSVSKLFTWTAVMQLVEEGKLNLDTDVNQYLRDVKIPATYPEPITLTHLLTHTPGFEDHVLALFGRGADDVEPLGTLLARQLPARVRPPGMLASYSNHGTALAGYIVACVSGMPWEDYVEQKILDPLGMRYTLVRQPAEDELPAEMSKGYVYKRGRYVEEGFEYVPLAPAGTIASSAADMTRFMIAHMQNGRYEEARILQGETAQRMREMLFTHDEALEGMGYGFMRQKYNGENIVQHGGDTLLFHSSLVLLPERNTGFFVSYNTDTGSGIRSQLLEAFVDRYFPAPDTADAPDEKEKPAAAETVSLDRLAGSYGGLRHSYTSITKLGGLLNVLNVSVDGEELLVNGVGGSPRRFAEVEPLLFREVDAQEMLAFRQDGEGRITHLFLGNVPFMAYERLRWHETPRFVLLLLGGSCLIFLSAVIGWPWAAFVARGAPSEPTFGSRLATWLGWVTSLAALALMVTAAYVMADPDQLAYGVTPQVEAMLWATPVIAALVAVLLLFALAAWIFRYWRFSGRLHYTCVLLAGIGLVWILYYGNLLQLPT